MFEQLEKCPVCTSRDFKPFLSCKDYTVSKEIFILVKCTSCQFTFTNPRPTEETIGKYYKAEEYISHTDSKKGLINQLYHQVRNITLSQKLNLVNSLSPQGQLLDVGCGTGYFLEKCKIDGWQITGTEPDDQARGLAIKKTNASILESIFELKFPNTFDIISLWHVLEHIHKLNESIEQLKYLIKVTGKIIIAVPNKNSWDAQFYKEYWAAYDVPRHLYHFEPATLIKLMDNHQFKIKQVRGMPFDSFYVSMMSQNYKNDKSLVKSLINGCKSNIYAIKNSNNYSSIIYIFERK